MKQLSLSGLFKGKFDVVPDKPKNKVGRPVTKKDHEDEGVEVKEKRPVGRPKTYKVSQAQEEELNELLAEYMDLDDVMGLVKGVEEVVNEEKKKGEAESKKVRKVLEKISKGLHELGVALGQAPAAQDECEGTLVQVEGDNNKTPKKQKVECSLIQDVESPLPSRTVAEIHELCKDSGKKGAEFGVLGGRPQAVRDEILSPQEKIIQHQLGIEESKSHRAVKERERDESFGFRAKAKFCQMWHKAGQIVSDEDNLMSYFVKVTGRDKASLRLSLIHI